MDGYVDVGLKMWGDSDVPEDDYIEKVSQLLGIVLRIAGAELRDQGLMTEDAFLASTLIVKMERERGGSSFIAVTSYPDEPQIALTLLGQVMEKLQSIYNKEMGNGKG